MHSDKKGWILLSRSLCNWQLRANLKLCIGCVRQSVALSSINARLKDKRAGNKICTFLRRRKRAASCQYWLADLWAVDASVEVCGGQIWPIQGKHLSTSAAKAPSWAGGKRQKLKALGNGILCGARCIINVLESEARITVKRSILSEAQKISQLFQGTWTIIPSLPHANKIHG